VTALAGESADGTGSFGPFAATGHLGYTTEGITSTVSAEGAVGIPAAHTGLALGTELSFRDDPLGRDTAIGADIHASGALSMFYADATVGGRLGVTDDGLHLGAYYAQHRDIRNTDTGQETVYYDEGLRGSLDIGTNGIAASGRFEQGSGMRIGNFETAYHHSLEGEGSIGTDGIF